MSLAVATARFLMELAPSAPEPTDLSLWEVFRHPSYTGASPDAQARMQLASAAWRYEYEQGADSLERYFPAHAGQLRGRRVLDLGCFTGGRLVAWAEKYGFASATGIDINPVFAEAGRRFASARAAQLPPGVTPIPFRFDVGVGERLPYDDGAFDAVVSLDVFEHVQDVEQVMAECRRVLAPGGLLLTCFPQYFQPLESHLGMFTRIPGLHLLFSGETIARAITAIGRRRGPAAAWYAYGSREPWERSPYLNGITVRAFRRLVARQHWALESWKTDPIFSDGRRARLPVFRFLRALARPAARLPIAEELFLGRICCVLRR